MAEILSVPEDPGAARYVQYRQISAGLAADAVQAEHPAPSALGAASSLARVRSVQLEQALLAARDQWRAVFDVMADPVTRAVLFAHEPRIFGSFGAGLVCATCAGLAPGFTTQPAIWPCPRFQEIRGAAGA